MRVQRSSTTAGVVRTIGTASVAMLAVVAAVCSDEGGGKGCPAEQPHECSWDDSFDQAECPSISEFEQCVVHVDPSVECSGSGSSWAEAKKTLQEGVDAAACGVLGAGMCATWQVWVRSGTNRINQGCVEDTLRLRSNVELYGGFVGNEIALTDRDPVQNVTVIEGQAEGSEELVNNVILAQGAEGAVLDGFTVSGGDAQIDAYTCANAKLFEGGGGIALFDGSLAITGCEFRDNYGKHGGAIGAWYSGLSIRDCVFEDNECQVRGGAVHGNDSSLELTDCTFTGNFAGLGGDYGGAGVFWEGGDATISNVEFHDNHANEPNSEPDDAWNCGGAVVAMQTEMSIEGCTFSGNSAGDEGGAIKTLGSQLTLSNSVFLDNIAGSCGGGLSLGGGGGEISSCTFTGNIAEAESPPYYQGIGGALESFEVESLTVNDCTFENNEAANDGGAFSSSGDVGLSFSGCVFSGNSAGGRGSGAFVQPNPMADPEVDEVAAADTSMVHCSFAWNTAANGGADVYFLDGEDGGSLDISSSILWSQTEPLAWEAVDADPVVSYSDVCGGCAGDGNIDADPLFVDEAGGDLHLSEGSPCIGTGEDGSDMGAFPYEGG